MNKVWNFFLTITILLSLTNSVVNAQKIAGQKGAKVYVSLTNTDDHTEDVKAQVVKQLQRWNYWTLTRSKNDADVVLLLNVQTHRGMTAWSWGGVTVKASAILKSSTGKVLWQSKTYKANPNGTNGFNTARSTASKIVAELQNHFN